ncbi:MAG: hypothetical protein LBG24_04790 [Treponema sp.]|jgi:outer membrane receptor for Fe3+-dicitrate|nr:hypothetical protein [Treponema sp.]
MVSGGHQGTQGYQKHTAYDTGNGQLRGIFDINDAMSLQANVGFTVSNSLSPYGYGLTEAEFNDDPTQNKGPSTATYSNAGVIAGMGFT